MDHDIPSNSPSVFLNNRYASSTSKFLNNRYSSSPTKFLNSRYSSSPTKFLNRKYDSSPTKFLNSRYSSSLTKFLNSRISSSPTKFLNGRYDSSPTNFLNSRYDSSPTKFLNSRYASSSPTKFLKKDNIVDDSQDHAVAPPAGLFFHQAEIRPGTTMKVSYPPTSLPPILPRDVAEKVPFTNFKDVLTTFNIAPGFAYAATLNDTIQRCQASLNNDGKQQSKACTISLESTVQSAKAMLGAGAAGGVASAIPRAGLPVRRYVVEEVSPLDGDRHVGCHDVPFPYAVYMCHVTGSTKAYTMSLCGVDRGGATTTVAMAALCHLDTKDWSPGHPAFEILRTWPGGAPVCHFLPYANLLFGEKKVAEA
ncbi:hypothetical protein EJB05_00541, partial [Eragrostis curvula]